MRDRFVVGLMAVANLLLVIGLLFQANVVAQQRVVIHQLYQDSISCIKK